MFTVYFSVVALQLNLVSVAYKAVVNIAWVVQRLRLTLSKGPIRVGVSLPSTEDGNGSSFPNVVFSSF
jgi:hypothetical protein